MAELQFPNMLAQLARGYDTGRQMKLDRKADSDSAALSALAQQAYGASGDERRGLVGQAVGVDPRAGFALGKQLEGDDTARNEELVRAARLLTSAPEGSQPQLWEQMRGQIGRVIPGAAEMPWGPDVLRAATSIVQAYGPSQGGAVQSTFVDAQGNRVAILRDGSTQVLGQNAPNTQIIDTGNGFFGVNKSNLQAAPVMVGQGAQQAPTQAGPRTQFTGADGAPVQIDPSLPPEVQAAIRADEGAFARAPDGSTANIGPAPGAGKLPPALDYSGGGQLRSAPKPAAPSELDRRIETAQSLGASEEDIRRMVLGRDAAAGGSKPLPTTALKLIQDETNAANTADGINQFLGRHLQKIKGGELEFGLVSNTLAQGRNFLGQSNQQSRNFQEFRSDLERLRNESLRLNTGVQTDGDAQRAWNELFANLNDTAFVQQRIESIMRLNERAKLLRQQNVEAIRANYGQSGDQEAPTAGPRRMKFNPATGRIE